MANDVVFVNPLWNSADNPIPVYVCGDSVYKDIVQGGTVATCYSTLARALAFANSGDTIYVYKDSASPLSLALQSGTYKLNGETYSCTAEDRKNLSVQAYQLRLDDYTSFALSGNITTVFSVSDSIVVSDACEFRVENGAVFGLNTTASFVNRGTISVTNGSSFSAAPTPVRNLSEIVISGSSFSVASVTNSVEIKIIGSSFSADSVVNTGNSTFTVTYTSTLNIGNLDGTIKTGSAGTTLNASSITGGGANGGTITALGNLTFSGTNTLRNISLDATDKLVTCDMTSSDVLWIKGTTSTLKIGELNNTIRVDDSVTFSDSTISRGNSNGKLLIYGGNTVTFAGKNTIFDASVDAQGYFVNNGSITVEKKNDVKGELTVYRAENSGSISVGSEGEEACTFKATTHLNNGGTITVMGKDQDDRSLLDAAYIKNGDNLDKTGKISLTNAVLNAKTLTNYAPGIFRGAAAITISNSTVSFVKSDGTGSLTNGAANNTSATIEFNNSTVTADSVTNYGTHNGTNENTGRVGFAVTDSTFTVNNTFTNYGWIYVFNSTLHATSLVNNGNRFYVYGTSTLNIGTLTGRIDIINGNDTGSLVTLNNSHITGKVNGDGSLGSSIYVSNPLTFTGTNTLTNTQFYATAANKTVTVGNSASLTVKGTSTLNIGNLNGTILTDSAATTTLKASSITNGTITAQNDLTFTGANTLKSVTLTATNQTVTIDSGATLNVNALSRITASAVSGGMLNVTTTGLTLSDMTQNTYHVVNADLQGNITVKLNDSTEATSVTIGTGEEAKTYNFIKLADQDLYLTTEDQSVLYVNSAYTEDSCDGHVYGYNAFSSAEDAALVAAESGAAVDVGNGTYTEITELRGAKTVIQKENGTTEFTKAVYGGTKVTDGGSDTRNTDVSIETGTFDKFFVGGNNIAMSTTSTSYTVDGDMQSVKISGGAFNAIVATGDRVQKGKFTLNSDLEMNISGGQFNYFVAGGLLNSLYEKDGENENTNGTAAIYGDISLNITGGVFSNDSWIYGGCVSTSRSVSSYASTIYGNVTITIDCGVSGDESERNDIVLSHVVAGSHGLGQILENSTTHSGGSTAIVFKGDNNSGGETPHSLINFTDDGELWGGCGRDNLSPVSGKCADSFVQGDRLLSFEGFTGELNCKQIRDFSSIQLIDESNVTLTESTVNLRGFETWTFEYDSCLSGNFGNDFNRDTLNLTGLDAKSFDDWTILTNSSDTAFKGFGSFSSVSFGTGEGSAASYSSGSDVWYNDAYVLYCSENSMLLTTNASYVTRFGSIA